MSELDELSAAIEALEAQRMVLGDAAVAAAVVGLSERLAALEQGAQPAPEGEPKQTTVMFADLSGFTALAETADAEDIRNLVNVCFERVGEVVKRYGGYIDKFIGDELMVLFGEAYRGEVEIKAGHPAEAVTRAERAVEIAKETRQQGCEAEAHRVLGWARHYAQPEAREPAEQELRTALELHRKTGATVQVAGTLYQMAAYLRLVGDEAGAAQAEAEASATARERGLDWLPTPPPTPIATAVSGPISER